jgi:hypothetical protein
MDPWWLNLSLSLSLSHSLTHTQKWDPVTCTDTSTLISILKIYYYIISVFFFGWIHTSLNTKEEDAGTVHLGIVWSIKQTTSSVLLLIQKKKLILIVLDIELLVFWLTQILFPAVGWFIGLLTQSKLKWSYAFHLLLEITSGIAICTCTILLVESMKIENSLYVNGYVVTILSMKVNPMILLNLWWLISFLVENFILFCWTLLRAVSQVRPCKKPQIFQGFGWVLVAALIYPQLKLFVFWVTPIFGPLSVRLLSQVREF